MLLTVGTTSWPRCGAWPGGAVTNADLDFSTRFRAAEAPEQIRTDHDVDQATGALMSRWNTDYDAARDRLRQAAQRAGITDAQMARAILALADNSASGDL